MSVALSAGGSLSPRISKRSWSEHELDGSEDSPSKTSSAGSLQSAQAPASSTPGHTHDHVPLSSGFTQPGSPALSADGPAKLPVQHASHSDQAPDTLTAKRRKTTAEEKLLKLVDKENKSKEKAELRAKREEDKRVKDEERRRKNELKEEKKREKEMEKQQKEEEQRKKERSQLKLNAFFAKPAPSPIKSSSATPANKSVHGSPSNRSPDRNRPQENFSEPNSPTKRSTVDYDRVFLPFALQSHSICAPENVFYQDRESLARARDRLDGYILGSDERVISDQASGAFWMHETQDSAKPPSTRGFQWPPAHEIIGCIQRTDNNARSSDLPGTPPYRMEPEKLLPQVPMKLLHFTEDVRPPYFGTFTRSMSRQEAMQLRRNPFKQILPNTNYDYDSEAEWEEPEEGEDLVSEGEEDAESADGDDDMEGFLDDEAGVGLSPNKRKHMAGDLAPVCSGLCWENEEGNIRLSHEASESELDFEALRMECLLDSCPKTIEPFSSAYWPPPTTPSARMPDAATQEMSKGAGLGPMNPPRRPLQSRPISLVNRLAVSGLAAKQHADAASMSKPQKRLVPADQLDEFKQAIQGSDLTKIALVEALKRRFPKIPKDAIGTTLSMVAQRVGAKEIEKRWVLLEQ